MLPDIKNYSFPEMSGRRNTFAIAAAQPPGVSTIYTLFYKGLGRPTK
jgi:hypothetical protein